MEFHILDTDHVINITEASNFDINEISVSAKDNKHSFEYTGRHDYGELPKLKNGSMNALLSSIISAKQACDSYLTEKILSQAEASKKQNDESINIFTNKEKRQKIEDGL